MGFHMKHRSTSPKSVLFKLVVIVEPLIYFRVCHGTPINKNLRNTNYL